MAGLRLFLASMPSEVKKGKFPAIHFIKRVWNDESKGVHIKMDPPPNVRNITKAKIIHIVLQEPFIGQTFCIRVMFGGFMVEASNIFSFEGEMSGEVKYSSIN